MRTYRLTIVGLAFLAAATSAPEPRFSQPAVLANDLATRYLEAFKSRFPESDPDNSDGLFDNSIEAYDAWHAREASFLTELQRVMQTLPGAAAEAMTLALMRERLEMSQQYRSCRRELWNVGPLTGWLNEYRALAARQPVGNDTARQAALRRWRKLPAFIDLEIANLRYGVAIGYTAPRMLVDGAIAQLDEVIAQPVAASPFYAPAAHDTSRAFRRAFESLVRDSLTPALWRYRNYLANEYWPRARTSVGLLRIPNGAACFRALIRRYTTLSITPSDLQSAGRALLASGQASEIRRRQLALRADPANRFANSKEALGAMTKALERAAVAAPKWFGWLPEPLIPVVYAMPDAGASDPDAVYVPATADQPPRVYVNVPRLMEDGGRLYAERLAFHEGTPGHHLQVALQNSADVHPLNRLLWNAAFGEGWAVYASNLAAEMGLYSSDVTKFAGTKAKIDDGLTFMVQDGLHELGWTRQEAVDTLLTYTGVSREEAAEQVNYFIAAPAHALAYPLGAWHIENLRREAARELGAKFDVRQFHDVVLSGGALPLKVLTESVRRWVKLRS